MNPFESTTKIEERLVLSATMKGIPLGGSFELLPLCNMNCRMCYIRLNPEEMQAQGRLRTAEEWLSLAREAREEGLFFLLLTGGEPFLYPEIEKLYNGLAELGLILTLNTNGTLIDEHYADMLAKHLPRRVNITLYGASDESYGRLCRNPKGFTQVMRAIHLLKERNVPLKLNGSLTKENREDLKSLQKIARELDIPLEVDTYMFPASRKMVRGFDYDARLTPEEAAQGYVDVEQDKLTKEEFKNLAQVMSECYHREKAIGQKGVEVPLTCRACRSSFWVNWKGNITPCVFMEQPGYDVFEKGFAAAWNQLKKDRDKILLPAECSVCEKRDMCQVCAACCYTEKGDTTTKPEYMCRMTEERLRLMNDWYVKQQTVDIEVTKK